MYENENYKEFKKELPEIPKGVKKGIYIFLILLSLALVRVLAIKRIPANTVGVKVSAFGGVQDTTLQTGYHFQIPFVDKVYMLPTSVQTKTMEKITTQTKDGQWLNTNIDVKYRVNKEKAMTVFSNYTTLDTVNDSVVSPAVQRAIESVNKRTEVYEMIDKALKEKFESYDLEFVSFTITDQDAGDEIEAAIKNESVKQKEIDTAKQEKAKAEVEAETKKVQAQAEANNAVIKAEGEAKANKVKSDSITDNLIRMKEAEAREKHGWVTVNGAGGVITNSGQ